MSGRNPGWVDGQTIDATAWNLWWSYKADATSGTLSGATISNSTLQSVTLSGVTMQSSDVSAALGTIGSVQGDILYRSATGWVVLGPGTSGQVLETGGAAANPSWVSAIPAASAGALLAASGTAGIAETLVLGANLSLSGNTLSATGGASQWAAGTVTTVGGGLTLSSGTLSATGTASLPSIGAGHLLANAGTATATASDTSLTALLDDVLGATQGQIIYRGASAWVALAPGTAGQALESGGTSANPSWVTSVPASDTLHILGASGTIGQAAAIAVGANLTLSANTLSAAGGGTLSLVNGGTTSNVSTLTVGTGITANVSGANVTLSAAGGSSWGTYAGTLSATGTTNATGTTLSADINVFTTVASGGIILLPSAPSQAKRVRVYNYGSNNALIYPGSTAAIGSQTLADYGTLVVGGWAEYVADSASLWIV